MALAAAPYVIATRAHAASILPSHFRYRPLPSRRFRTPPPPPPVRSPPPPLPCHAAPLHGGHAVLRLRGRRGSNGLDATAVRFAGRAATACSVFDLRGSARRVACGCGRAHAPHSCVHGQASGAKLGGGGAAWLGGFSQAQACHASGARTGRAGIWLRGRRGAGGDHSGAPLAQDLNSAFQDVSVRYVGRYCKLQLGPSRISCTFRVPKGSSGPALALATPPQGLQRPETTPQNLIYG